MMKRTEEEVTRDTTTGKTGSGWTRRKTSAPPRWLLTSDFRLVWWGQVVSQMGDGVSKLALLWFVYSVTGSPLKTSIIGLLQTIPAIVLAPLIGVIVDRVPKKLLLISSDVVRAIVLGVVPCAMPTDTFSVGHLYILVTLHAIATAVFGPALTASIPSLVHPTQYTSANALLQSTTSLGIIIGPALSGIGIAALSSQEVLCWNAVTYLIAAACFVPIRLVPPTVPLVKQPAVTSVLQDMLEGLRYVLKGQPVFVLLTATAAVYTFGISAFTTLFPVFGRRLLDLGPVEIGYLWSMLGVGLLLTSIGLTTISAWSVPRRIHIITLSSAVSGVALFSFVWAKGPIWAALILAVLGAGVGVLTPIAWGVLQEWTPPHLLGRSLSFYTMGAMAAAMGGITFFGWLSGEFGEKVAVMAIGLMMFATALMSGLFLSRVGIHQAPSAHH
jgi:MFS transporter, DHA3 family, macrolide efflux protein